MSSGRAPERSAVPEQRRSAMPCRDGAHVKKKAHTADAPWIEQRPSGGPGNTRTTLAPHPHGDPDCLSLKAGQACEGKLNRLQMTYGSEQFVYPTNMKIG